MKNPWNIQMFVDIDEEILTKITDWYYLYTKLSNHEKKIYREKNKIDDDVKEIIINLYEGGYGIKTLSRKIGLTYSQFRGFYTTILGGTLRKGYNVSTEITKQFRSNRIKGNKNPWYKWPEKDPTLMTRNQKGIQGYYKTIHGQYIWLRSTWEYIYVKWLDKNNINWKQCEKSIRLSNGESYLPDFILDDNKIIELKGSRFKDRLYKPKLLKEDQPELQIIIIDDILPYQEKNYKLELAEWKKVRLSKQELEKLM